MRRTGNLTPALAIALVLALGATSCATNPDSGAGAEVGAGNAKAAAGIKPSTGGILNSAAIGGAAGRVIGDYMDEQAREIGEEVSGAQVERAAEGINIRFDSSLLFDVGKADLSSSAKKTLASLSEVLLKYADTNVLIEGHTDSSGPDEANMALSKRRARAVRIALIGNGVSPSRLKVEAYGETQPIAPNNTEWGRQENRRVELAIYANEDLKAEAAKQIQG